MMEDKKYSIPSFVEEDEAPKTPVVEEEVKTVSKTRKIRYDRLAIVIAVPLLVLALIIGGVSMGVNAYKEAQEKEAERLRLEAEEKARLEAEAKAKAEEEARQKELEAKLGDYTLQVTLNVRVGAGTEYEKAIESMIPSEYHEALMGSQLPEGFVVKVLEVKEDGENLWGRIGDAVWICLVNEGEVYASQNK